jgi:hypothetical protein
MFPDRAIGGAFLAAVAAAIIVGAPSSGSAAVETLKSVYAAILEQPDSIELNLRYARLAEAEGKPRLALAAYERILLSHPDNAAAKTGLLRIKRLLTPERTSFETRFAIAFETNPRHQTMPLPEGEANGWARIAMTDERRLGDTMWRSYGLLYGALHGVANDLNYGYASFVAGPLLDGAGFTIHPTIGGGVAAFQNRLYFAEALAAIAIEGEFNGAMQTVRLRGGYRDYGDFFPSDNGFFADLTGRFAFPNVAETGGTLVIAPWARWSGIDGTGFDQFNFVDVVPGRYVEVGGRIEHVQPVANRVALAANFEVNKRWYTVDPRDDLRLAPGAAIIFKNAFAYANDIRLDYQYVENDSTDNSRDYVDHIVTLQVINRY